tara:strand:- start:771 stop:1547 length:777 start_codon:yes stop_codon:yes gene_type:complete
MKQLTEKQIQDNWSKLRGIINDTFEGTRLEKLNKMYDYFEDRMILAPASAKEHYHNAMVGGYVEHVLHIVDFSQQVRDIWLKNGAEINFSNEELVFAALHHDLGKVGDLEHDYYVINESEWHRKNQGKIYNHNPDLVFMTVTDRALFLLQHFGINMSVNEYLGLKLTDGLYEDGNEKYLKTFLPETGLRSHIARVLHQADMMATYIESDEWKRSDEEYNTNLTTNIKKAVEPKVEIKEVSPKLSSKSQDLFDELFGDK